MTRGWRNIPNIDGTVWRPTIAVRKYKRRLLEAAAQFAGCDSFLQRRGYPESILNSKSCCERYLHACTGERDFIHVENMMMVV
jgi:hypothetical protein